VRRDAGSAMLVAIVSVDPISALRVVI
jgi:hypothetical protein